MQKCFYSIFRTVGGWLDPDDLNEEEKSETLQSVRKRLKDHDDESVEMKSVDQKGNKGKKTKGKGKNE